MISSYERPSFSEAEIDLERRRIAVIDQLLAERGALMADHLFGLVKIVDGSLFPKFTMLKIFIQSRTNIFQADEALSTKIRNRSIEYREAILYIVDQMAKSSKQQKVNFVLSSARFALSNRQKMRIWLWRCCCVSNSFPSTSRFWHLPARRRPTPTSDQFACIRSLGRFRLFGIKKRCPNTTLRCATTIAASQSVQPGALWTSTKTPTT